MFTEEYQLGFIRRYLDVAEQRPFMAGMHVRAFADFRTGQNSSRAGSMKRWDNEPSVALLMTTVKFRNSLWIRPLQQN